MLKIIGAVMPLRANDEEQSIGLDVAMHGEDAYVHTGGMGTAESAGGHATMLTATPVLAD